MRLFKVPQDEGKRGDCKECKTAPKKASTQSNQKSEIIVIKVKIIIIKIEIKIIKVKIRKTFSNILHLKEEGKRISSKNHF